MNEAMSAGAHETQVVHTAVQHDYRFHARLVGILGNKQIGEIYRIMKPVMLKIMENRVARTKSHGANFTEHAGIIDALESRNRLAYKYRMSQHLEAGLALFKE
jgi:DNA-binding FadR family transcriptional regulator